MLNDAYARAGVHLEEPYCAAAEGEPRRPSSGSLSGAGEPCGPGLRPSAAAGSRAGDDSESLQRLSSGSLFLSSEAGSAQ